MMRRLATLTASGLLSLPRRLWPTPAKHEHALPIDLAEPTALVADTASLLQAHGF